MLQLSYKRLALYAAALLFVGAAAANVPGCYADWRFLRMARLVNEAAAATQPQPAPSAAKPVAPAAKGP